MPSDLYVEQALIQHKRSSQALLCVDVTDFEQDLRDFVRTLRHNALAWDVVSQCPRIDLESWWNDILDRAENSYGPAELRWPRAEDERLALLAGLLTSMATETLCTFREFGAALNCHTSCQAVLAVQELVARPFCDLLEARLAAFAEAAERRLAS